SFFHVLTDRLFFRENQLIFLAVQVQDANFERLLYQAVEPLQDFVLVGAGYARIVLGAELRYRQETAYTFVLHQQSTTIGVIGRDFKRLALFEQFLELFPAAVLGGLP